MSLVARVWARMRWVRRSTILRLSLLLSALFAVGFAIAIFVALTLGQSAIERRTDATLAALARSNEGNQISNRTMILRPANALRDLPDPIQRAALRGGGTADLHHDMNDHDVWRVLITPNRDGDPVLVAMPLDDSEEARELLAGILWTTAAVVVAATLLIGVVAGGLAQRRLSRITATLTHLAQGDLSARTDQRRAHDDLGDMAHQLDVTAAELERLVTQTRHLSASIAHDLRTPLARLRARLETLPDSDARGDALEEATRLSEIFDTIMRVARIEATQGRDGFETVEIAALLEDIQDIFAPVVEDAGKTLIVACDGDGVLQADRQMLVQAVANLIQNALVHGGSEITLFGHGATLGVADNGDGVDPERYDDILKPMVRLDAARTSPGSGLGLALVRAVADRHGAALELTPNVPHGLRVTLNFAQL